MKHPFDTLLFDLDGTITDSQEGIFHCAIEALAAFGVARPPENILRELIGPPLDQSLQRLFGFAPAEVGAVVETFRRCYGSVGWRENRIYDGLPALLAALRTAGYRLYVATSKPERFAKQILQEVGLLSVFDGIAGAGSDESHNEKWEVITDLLAAHPEIAVDRARMIGDRKYDVLGAARCGIETIGVTYGFGDRAELETAGAVVIVDSVAALGEYLL